MRRFLPILVITLFALIPIQPLIVNEMTCSDDGFFHIAKAVTLEQLIRDGQPFSRWSPEMAHGYGYPYFNYYGPLASYILIGIHSLGFIYPVAMNILFAMGIWVAGIATYFFVRDWWGEAAGVTAAVVYMTAPYMAFDVLFRTALAESLALVWIPIIFFTLHRALTQRPVFYAPLAALSFAALLYTHNTTSLVTAPLLAGYVVLLAWFKRDLRKLILGASILAMGLALSARFWLPALAESKLVRAESLLVPPVYSYYTNYLSIESLLSPPFFEDLRLVANSALPKSLGLITLVLAVLGFISDLRRPQAETTQAKPTDRLIISAYFLLATLTYAFLTLPISRPIWDVVPLMPFIQFPWRLLGPASLAAAVLAGASVLWLKKHQWIASSFIIAIAVIGSLSWWYPRYCSPFQETTLAGTIQYEYDTATIGTSATGEFLPKTVSEIPKDDTFGKAIIRGERAPYLTGLPPTAKITVHNPYPLTYNATIILESSASLVFNQFFFPGWYATLDNQPLDLQPQAETGLITLVIPSGTHKLNIAFGNTPARSAGDIISLIALALVIAYGGVLIFYRSSANEATQTQSSQQGLPFVFLLLPIALLLFRLNNPLRISPFNGDTLSTGRPINVDMASGLKVLSTEYPDIIESGSEFDITLYITPREYTSTEYRPRFDLISSDGYPINNGEETLVPRWHREPPGTQYWQVGQYGQWARRIAIFPGAPPGDYEIRVTLFDRGTLKPDSSLDKNGNYSVPYVSLGKIRVTRPTTAAANIKMQFPTNQKFGALTLLGYNMDRDAARGGDNVYFTFFFRADQSPISNLQFNLLNPYYPTSQWKQGDVWRFQTKARVPADADTSTYRFTLKSPDASLELAPIKVIPIQRTFTAPAIQNPTSIKFGDVIELAGYNIKGDQIDLIWKALSTPDQDLIAFIHVEDSSGKIIAQSDSVPANWSRPTTGWVKGEYILDTRTLSSLSNGGITVYVGFADRSSGERFGDRLSIYKVP